jgi:hypothetical protein
VKKLLSLLLLLLVLPGALAFLPDFILDRNLTFKNQSVSGSWGIVNASFICLGSPQECRTSWPTGGDGFWPISSELQNQSGSLGINDTYLHSVTLNSTDELNASNLGTGTVPMARLDADVVVASELTAGLAAQDTCDEITGCNNVSEVAAIAPNITLSGTSYISLTGQALTASAINLVSHVTGILQLSNLNTSALVTILGNWTADRTAYLNTTNSLWTGNVTRINNLVTENASLWTNASTQAAQIGGLNATKALAGSCTGGNSTHANVTNSTSATSAPTCIMVARDGGSGTTYSNGTGLNLSSTVFSLWLSYRLPQGCSNGAIPEYNTSSGGWDCAVDDQAASGMSNWVLAAEGTGGSETITEGETVTFIGDSPYLSFNRSTNNIYGNFNDSLLNATIDARSDFDTDTNCSALGSCTNVLYTNTLFSNRTGSRLNITGNSSNLVATISANNLTGDDILESSLGTVPTATALAADPANCAAGSSAAGVTAGGVAEGCQDTINTSDSAGGEASGTFGALVLSDTALDDQYLTVEENTTIARIGTAQCSSIGQRVYNVTVNTTGVYVLCGTDETGGAGSNPGGADTNIQFNDGGVFNGTANFTFNKTSNTLFLNGSLHARQRWSNTNQFEQITPAGNDENILIWDKRGNFIAMEATKVYNYSKIEGASAVFGQDNNVTDGYAHLVAGTTNKLNSTGDNNVIFGSNNNIYGASDHLILSGDSNIFGGGIDYGIMVGDNNNVRSSGDVEEVFVFGQFFNRVITEPYFLVGWGSTALQIDSFNNVVINNTVPTQTLSVRGSGNFTTVLYANDLNVARNASAGNLTVLDSGKLFLPATGTAAAPTLAFGSGLDTGFYESGNTLSVSTAGSQRFTIDSQGLNSVQSNGPKVRNVQSTQTDPAFTSVDSLVTGVGFGDAAGTSDETVHLISSNIRILTAGTFGVRTFLPLNATNTTHLKAANSTAITSFYDGNGKRVQYQYWNGTAMITNVTG